MRAGGGGAAALQGGAGIPAGKVTERSSKKTFGFLTAIVDFQASPRRQMPRGLGGGGGGEVLQGVQAEGAFRQCPANVQVINICCLEKTLWELVDILGESAEY